jgi:uncharacterized protein with FMN-binding domain
MKLPQMGKACLFSLALAPLVGTSINFGDSTWTMFIGLAVMLLVVAIVIRVNTARSGDDYYFVEKRADQKLSSRLVVLSSAAVLTVYGAGYFRTSSAANLFSQQTARQTSTAPLVAGAVPPPALPETTSQAGSAASPSQTAKKPRKAAAPRDPSTSASLGTRSGSSNEFSSPGEPGYSYGYGASPGPYVQPTTDPSAPTTAQVQYKDGTFLGWGSCRHGDIQASVVIEGGQIVSAEIAQCLTRYPCTVISRLPGQAVTRQSPNVDVVSGASQSAFAFHDAVADALNKAQ